MHVRDWVRSLPHPEFTPAKSLWLNVCAESLAPLLASGYLGREEPRQRILVLTADHERCLQWQARLHLCGVPPAQIKLLSTSFASLFDDNPPERFSLSDRAGALSLLSFGSAGIVIGTPQAALERCLSPKRFSEGTVRLKVGESISGDELGICLTQVGYEREDPVRRPGGFVQRGGIIDAFPAGSEFPFRIELFGDQIESIRKFDPESQRSITTVDEAVVPPLRSVIPHPFSEKEIASLTELLDRRCEQFDAVTANALRATVEADLLLLRKGVLFNRLEIYAPFLHDAHACAIDYLGDGMIFLEEPLELEIAHSRSFSDVDEGLTHRAAEGETLPLSAYDFSSSYETITRHPNLICATSLNESPSAITFDREVDLQIRSLAPYRGNSQGLARAIDSWKRKGVRIVVATDQPTRARQVLRQMGDSPVVTNEATTEAEVAEAQTLAIAGNLAGGFLDESNHAALLTDAELFGIARLRLPQRRFNEGVPIASVLDIKPGDYIVHIQYGIGQYRGMVKREVDGHPKEFLHIEYSPPDKLLVPTDQLDRVQKYLGTGDGAPQLHRITGSEWARAVKSAKKGAEDLARDLIKVYARRSAATRPPYGEDTPWQTEMEASFEWIETPSQLAAIETIKADLLNQHPMDRLVCGDVGFGKTEVAIRAAFKVVQSGYQVAVLCPTTILAEQHYLTFVERLAAYPVRLKQLSRLRSSKERSETLALLAKGEVDIVIGTHSLLQKDVQFAKLGLIVVDEEQRFGVKHKERLKELKSSADCLTLTATPIPRTLNMALMNIRPMSLINDPPPGRLPIRTYVRAYGDQIVREALLRELSRGGQAFYVFNRVMGINHQAELLRKLLPNARIAVAHGQMPPQAIEPVMEAFYHHEIDVLVSTTIIENGIDNSHANTIIVDGADKLGLAQLYQLRGRVGRSDRQAYAYLLYRSAKNMTEAGVERLKALQEFGELGSGYSLAFRDLQIRGAGELLGAKQHGLMQTVGYEMYVNLINQAVQQLKSACDDSGEQAARLAKVELEPAQGLATLPVFEIPLGAYLPHDYIRDDNQRLFYYKKLMETRDLDSLSQLCDELQDRYGKLPRQAKNAVDLVKLRVRAHELGIRKVEGKEGTVSMFFDRGRELPIRVINSLTRAHKGLRFRPDRIEWRIGKDVLESIAAAMAAVTPLADDRQGSAVGTANP